MSKFDLHEQNNNLQYFWQKAGKYVVGLVIIALIAYGVNTWWNSRNSIRAADAALVYEAFTSAYNSKDANKVLEVSKELQSDYSSTEYATMATLLSAKMSWDKKDFTQTAKSLNWVINNSKDVGMVNTAKLRLADIYIDEKKYDKATKLLLEKHDPAFDPLYYSKRGDLYLVQGDKTKARDAYKEALKKAGQDSSMSQGIQMRLDVLGNN